MSIIDNYIYQYFYLHLADYKDHNLIELSLEQLSNDSP